MKTRNGYFKARRKAFRMQRRCERCGDKFPHGDGAHVLCAACRDVMKLKNRERRVSHKIDF